MQVEKEKLITEWKRMIESLGWQYLKEWIKEEKINIATDFLKRSNPTLKEVQAMKSDLKVMDKVIQEVESQVLAYEQNTGSKPQRRWPPGLGGLNAERK